MTILCLFFAFSLLSWPFSIHFSRILLPDHTFLSSFSHSATVTFRFGVVRFILRFGMCHFVVIAVSVSFVCVIRPFYCAILCVIRCVISHYCVSFYVSFLHLCATFHLVCAFVFYRCAISYHILLISLFFSN